MPRLDRVAAAAVIVAALVVYARTGVSHHMLVWDEAEYAGLGRSMARGEGYAIVGRPERLRPPLLPAAIASSFLATQRTDDAAAFRPIPWFAAASLTALFLFVARAAGGPTALVASSLLASNVTFCSLSTSVLAEIPFLVFWIAGLWCVFFALHEADWWLYPAWTLFALACLTRYNALAFGPTVVLYIVVAAVLRVPTRWRLLVRSRAFWMAPVVAAVLLAPWFVRQHLAFGDALAGVRIGFIQLEVFPASIEPPAYYLTSLPSLVGWPALALMAVALAALARRRDPATLFSLVAAAFVMGWLSRYPTKDARLVSSALPFLLTLSAIGAAQIVRMLGGRDTIAWRAAALPIAAVVAGQALNTSALLRGQVALGYPSFREAMTFAADRPSAVARLIGPNPAQMSWYADRPSEFAPPNERDLAARLAAATPLEWVVVTNFERSQPAYLAALRDRLTAADYQDGAAVQFRDPQFLTVLIRADRLKTLLATR